MPPQLIERSRLRWQSFGQHRKNRSTKTNQPDAVRCDERAPLPTRVASVCCRSCVRRCRWLRRSWAAGVLDGERRARTLRPTRTRSRRQLILRPTVGRRAAIQRSLSRAVRSSKRHGSRSRSRRTREAHTMATMGRKQGRAKRARRWTAKVGLAALLDHVISTRRGDRRFSRAPSLMFLYFSTRPSSRPDSLERISPQPRRRIRHPPAAFAGSLSFGNHDAPYFVPRMRSSSGDSSSLTARPHRSRHRPRRSRHRRHRRGR